MKMLILAYMHCQYYGNYLWYKKISAKFILKNYDDFMEKYFKLLNSDSYIIKRYSLEILNITLLNKEYSEIMLKFIQSDENMKK